jgi:hypothetical protein
MELKLGQRLALSVTWDSIESFDQLEALDFDNKV